jgi:hypothetical protein
MNPAPFLHRLRFILLASALLAPLIISGAPAAPAEAHGRAAAFDHPTVDPQAIKVDGMSFTLGRMSLTWTHGRASLVKVDGVPAGIFFCGEGSVSYLSTDPAEHSVLKFNLDRNTGLEAKPAPGGLQMNDALRTALVWFGGMPLPALNGVATEGVASEFKEQRAYFAFREWAQVGNLMALREANAPDRRLVVAELEGKHHRGVFLYDDALSHKESYSATTWRETPGAPAITSVPLSETFLQGSRNNPLDPDFVLNAVDLDLKASKGSSVKMRLVETVVPVKPSLRMLAFNLDSSRYYWDGGVFVPVPIRVERVTTESGTPISFEHHQGNLLLSWPQPLVPSQPIKLCIDLSGDFLLRHDQDNYWELGIDNWFPQPEPSGQAYTVHCRMAVEKPFLPIAPGHVVRQEETATHHILETTIDRPVCFLSVAAGKFVTRDYTSPNTAVKVRLYGYNGLSDSQGERLGKTIQGFIGFYQTFLGRYPLDDLVVIERNELGHGQAPPGLLFLTGEAFNPLGDEVARAFAIAWINQGVAHEVAHQYWGIQVRMFDRDDQWISEAFSEYCAALAMRQIKGTGKDRFNRAFARWTSQAKTANQATTISHANWLRPKARGEFPFRQFSMYDKGALLLGAIHKDLGDQGFAQFLSTYQKEFAWRATITQDIPDLLKRLTGKDWNPFFGKYYWGSEFPESRP